MGRITTPFVLAALFSVAAPDLCNAQCNPVPNTGCPGQMPVQCSGSTQIGQLLQASCFTNGRESAMFLILDTCTFPYLLPPTVACVSGCMVGVNLGLQVAIDTQFGTVFLPIPNNSGLIGLQLCMQCAGVVTSGPCATLGQAVSFTIQ